MVELHPALSNSLSNPCTIPINSKLSIRLYPDCRPNCLETAPLQKGLVLMLNGKELIEEGVGFGVPVVKYADKTFFSSKATIDLHCSSSGYALTKAFVLDSVSIKRLGSGGYIDDQLYTLFRKKFELLYLKHKKLNPLFNKAMEARDLFRIRTEFKTVKPRGTIKVTYNVQPNVVNITTDLSDLTLNDCQEVMILNEQGARFFPKYSDNAGNKLIGNKIGAWDRVAAETGVLSSLNGQLSFSLRNVRGAVLYRGFEFTRKRFSWVGLSYSLKPVGSIFDYSIYLSS